jgi:hypothetical protein
VLHYDALRQLTHESRLHHEAEGEAERLALQARGRSVRPLPLARELQELRAARRHAMERTGHVLVTVWPRR